MIDEEPREEEQEVALDAHVKLLDKLAECNDNLAFWKSEKEKAQAALDKIMGDATVGTLDGRQVVTYRFEDRFRGQDFQKAYPDTYKSFVTTVEEEKFNVRLFRLTRPEMYDQFRVRSMKSTYKRT